MIGNLWKGGFKVVIVVLVYFLTYKPKKEMYYEKTYFYCFVSLMAPMMIMLWLKP